MDPDVLRDASEYLKEYYSDSDRKCKDILYEFRRKVGVDGTLIVIHKRYENGWGQPTSYSYEDLQRVSKFKNARCGVEEYPKFEIDGNTLTYKTIVTVELIKDIRSLQGLDCDEVFLEVLTNEFKDGLYKFIEGIHESNHSR